MIVFKSILGGALVIGLLLCVCRCMCKRRQQKALDSQVVETSKNEKKSQENVPTQADQVLETLDGAKDLKTERDLIPAIKKEDDDDFAIKALDKEQPVPDQLENNTQFNLTSV